MMSFAVAVPDAGAFDTWRVAARRAISFRIAPDQIDWNGDGGLFVADPLPDSVGPHESRVPKDFLRLAESVIWHSEPARFSLLYQALWRLDQGNGAPLSPADPLGRRLQLMGKSVGRDIHKMHAFVRFRELPSDGPRRQFGAWFEPEHHTLEPGSSFFARRFADMDWFIATPRQSAYFTDGVLTFGPGGARALSDQPATADRSEFAQTKETWRILRSDLISKCARPDLPDDASEALWATYFTNIFNPARIKLTAMRSEMPKKYWKNLPETRLIPGMLADAEARVARMQAAGATTPRPGAASVSERYRAGMPTVGNAPETLEAAGRDAAQCRRCGLCEAATQTVWGEGAPDAAGMIVGEQPGDREDLLGRPFVGPAGTLLRELMAGAGVDPAGIWLTNAVKHFKFRPSGKRRIHQSPNQGEIKHCRWWLGLELNFVRPRLTLALGASAALALTGDDAPLTQRRGRIETGLHSGPVLVTWHPAHVLRLNDQARGQEIQEELGADLKTFRSILEHDPV